MTDFEKGDVLRIRGDIYQVKAVDPRPTMGGDEYTQYRLVRGNGGELLGQTAAKLQPRHRDDAFEWTLTEATGLTEDEVEVVD